MSIVNEKNTLPIINPSEITGNVGSCTTSKLDVISARESFWIQSYNTIATNSCDGMQTIVGSHWEFSGMGSLVIVFPFILLLTILHGLISD